MEKKPIWAEIIARALAIIFQLAVCLFLLELGLRLAGFVVLSLQERRNSASIQQKGAYRIMCLGESTTAAGGINSYPSQLQDIINRRKIGVTFSVINKGVPGIHTSDIVNRLGANLEAYQPDMVISMMGAGDLGSYMLYESGSGSRAINFLRSLRVYKIGRIFGLDIITRAKAAFLDKAGKNISRPAVFLCDPDKEISRLEKAINSGPKNDAAYFELGWIYRAQGRHSEAEASFRKAIALNPKNYWPYVEHGDFAGAEAVFRKAIARDPENDWPYVGQGWLYLDQGKFPQAERSFRKAIKLDPQNYWAYLELGRVYQEQERFIEAAAAFNKAGEINPEDYRVFLELGCVYDRRGRYPQAEELFKKAIDLNPGNDGLYIRLGRFYLEQGRFIEADALFRQAIELNPQNDQPYAGMGQSCREQGRSADAEYLFRKAMELNPRNSGPYSGLGWIYQDQGKIPEAEALFKKAIAVNPNDDLPYFRLGLLYRGSGRLSGAEEAFKKALEINPTNDRACGALKVLYTETGNPKLAREYDNKANELRSGYYPQSIIDNYRKLKAVLDKRGIVYVCMQYPLRSVEPLKAMFRGGDEGIIFVDNQKVFREALKGGGYDEYFTDMIGGDFGHCTAEGNRLLAENAANVILDKVFSVKSGGDAAQDRKNIKIK